MTADPWRPDRPTGPGPTVYVVDPDETVRNNLEGLFRPLRLAVRSFPSAEEFLDAVNGTRAGCLIVESDLPGISGLDLQDTLYSRGIDLPVIVLSQEGTVPTAVRAIRAGAIDFIEKPFLPNVLVRLVRKTLRFATAQ